MVRLARIPVVLVSGRINAGKTTFANELCDIATRAGIKSGKFSFAGKLKDIATTMGWDGNKDLKGRRLLQSLGFVGREYNINTWVKFVLENIRISEVEFVAIDDWRFPNEYDYFEYIHYIAPFKIRINRNVPLPYGVDSIDNDSSETSLPDGDYSYYHSILNNDSSVHNLKYDAEQVFNSIINNKKCLWE